MDMIILRRRCPKCKRILPLARFIRPHGKSGRKCNECTSARFILICKKRVPIIIKELGREMQHDGM